MTDRLSEIEGRLTAQLPENARMDAYYYGFGRTGFGAVDAILSAVAVAGKGSHHTDSWNDEESGWYYANCPGLPSGDSAVDLIQKTADLAARNVTTDITVLLNAVKEVRELANYLDTLAPGDQHYAKLMREAVTKGLEAKP